MNNHFGVRFNILTILFAISGIKSVNSQTMAEGLWHVDNKPEFIAIKEGKIVSILRIQWYSDEKNPVLLLRI